MPKYSLRPLKDLGIEVNRDDPEITILTGKPEMKSFFTGDGDSTYVCGDCGATLLKDVEPGAVQQVAFECLGCGELLYLPAHDA